MLRHAGFMVALAPGEADVYIANQESSVCVSSDSDYLFHKNVTVLGRFRVEEKVAEVYAFDKKYMIRILLERFVI